MEISNSLQWTTLEIELKERISHIKNPKHLMQARKVLQNIEDMITKLSQLEQLARRSPSGSLRNVQEQLDKINEEVLQFEYWLTILMLA